MLEILRNDSNERLKFRAVFLVVLPCKMIFDRRFRGAYCLHHQGWIHPWWWRQSIILHGRQSFYTAVQPRRQLWTSYSPPWELEISRKTKVLEICTCLLDFMPRFSHYLCVFLHLFFAVTLCVDASLWDAWFFFCVLTAVCGFFFIVLSATVRCSTIISVYPLN
jgi:hypothetical protein